MRRVDLQRLSDRKIESAQVLARAGHWADAYYLAGYSIEMALKSVISRQISVDTIPDKNMISKVYTHDFKTLIGLAGLKADFDKAVGESSLFGSNWAIVSEWSPECRYQEKSNAEITFLLVAATQEPHGVLPWIKKYW